MGLLDQISSMLGGSGDGKPGTEGVPGALLGLLGSQDGALAGLAEKFKAGGLGDAFASWVGTEDNHEVAPDALHGVLGSDLVQQLCAKTGLPVAEVLKQVSEHLPTLINSVTPNGQMPGTADELLAAGSSFLKSKLGLA